MKKILIIDDDPQYTEAISILLESTGYNVLKASDGSKGFNSAKKEKPDLIILDVMMARTTEGFDTARKLKKDKNTKDIPVIISTGIQNQGKPFDLEPDEDWLPVKTVLQKPVNPEELLKAIEENIR